MCRALFTLQLYLTIVPGKFYKRLSRGGKRLVVLGEWRFEIDSRARTARVCCSHCVCLGGSVSQLMLRTPSLVTISKEKAQAGLPLHRGKPAWSGQLPISDQWPVDIHDPRPAKVPLMSMLSMTTSQAMAACACGGVAAQTAGGIAGGRNTGRP